MVEKSSWWYPFHYHIIPPLLIIFSIITSQYLSILGQGQSFCWDLALSNYLGDSTSFKWTSLFILWSFIWLKLPSKTVEGPETSFGTKPTYKVRLVS